MTTFSDRSNENGFSLRRSPEIDRRDFLALGAAGMVGAALAARPASALAAPAIAHQHLYLLPGAEESPERLRECAAGVDALHDVLRASGTAVRRHARHDLSNLTALPMLEVRGKLPPAFATHLFAWYCCGPPSDGIYGRRVVIFRDDDWPLYSQSPEGMESLCHRLL